VVCVYVYAYMYMYMCMRAQCACVVKRGHDDAGESPVRVTCSAPALRTWQGCSKPYMYPI